MAHVPTTSSPTDIEAYLELHEHKSLLRFITCGSVDDGKSTLIGRLLYESKLIFEDQLAALEADSKRVGTQGGELDFALLVDGLAAEREQGITIDVAYRFFSTEQRKFIVADTPGPRAVHPQHGHRRVDRRPRGDPDRRPQGCAHPDPAPQLPRLAARHPPRRPRGQQAGPRRLRRAGVRRDRGRLPRASPPRSGSTTSSASRISALRGDNITEPSANTPWYDGPDADRAPRDRSRSTTTSHTGPFRMPVQWVNRRTSTSAASPADRRRHGRARATGSASCPRARESTVGPDRHLRRRPRRGGRRPVGHAHPRRRDRRQPRRRDRRGRATRRPWPTSSRPRRLDERGTRCCRAAPTCSKIGATHRRRHRRPAQVQGQRQHARAHRGQDARAQRDRRVQPRPRPADRLRPLRREPRHGRLHPDRPAHQRHRRRRAAPLRAAPRRQRPLAGDRRRQGRPDATLKGQRPAVRLVHRPLRRRASRRSPTSSNASCTQLGWHTYLLDGDNVRHGLNKDLGFTDADRVENIRRVGRGGRAHGRRRPDRARLVHLAVPGRAPAWRATWSATASSSRSSSTRPLEVAEARDRKGLYAKARRGELTNFTGIDSPYEAPENPDLHVLTGNLTPEQAADAVIGLL